MVSIDRRLSVVEDREMEEDGDRERVGREVNCGIVGLKCRSTSCTASEPNDEMVYVIREEIADVPLPNAWPTSPPLSLGPLPSSFSHLDTLLSDPFSLQQVEIQPYKAYHDSSNSPPMADHLHSPLSWIWTRRENRRY